jgi:PPOX class probable FMN-dependent enzyme
MKGAAMDAFDDVVTSEDELRALIGTPSDLALKKEISRLDTHCRAFIARSPFLLLATANAAGQCDVSPKGDAPGFVRVLDDEHLVIPDRPGNRRLDGMRNLLANPHLGLVFLIPGKDETLRVNGRACIIRDAAILDSLAVMGKRPLVCIGVTVEECFLHCGKAFKRSRLWQPDAWPDLADLPSAARMFYDQARPAGTTAEELQRRLEDGYAKGLY